MREESDEKVERRRRRREAVVAVRARLGVAWGAGGGCNRGDIGCDSRVKDVNGRMLPTMQRSQNKISMKGDH